MNIREYAGNELVASSIILLILSNIANLLNFAFQFIMARMLSPSDFGALSFIGNLIFLFGVPALAIQTAISKKTTFLFLRKEYGKIKGLFGYSTKKLCLISLLLMAFYIILSFFLHEKIGMSLVLLLVSSVMILLSLIYPVITGVIQGMKRFQFLGWNSIINFSVKLFLGVLLVFLGFRVYGALIGIIFGIAAGWISGSLILAGFKEEKETVRFFSKSELVPFVSLLVITLMYSMDILVAKFAFAPEIMGNYSKISLLGKMILFACMTVAMVMFPISFEKHISKSSGRGVVSKSSFLTGAIILLSLAMCYLFPELIIKVIFGEKYIEFAGILFTIGIAFSSISLINLLVLHKISVDRFSRADAVTLILLFLAQFAALIYYSGDILSYTRAFAASTTASFIALFLLSLTWKD